jgi:hypothetical protein
MAALDFEIFDWNSLFSLAKDAVGAPFPQAR